MEEAATADRQRSLRSIKDSPSVVTSVTTPRAPRCYIGVMKPKHTIYLLGAALAYFTIAVLAARPVWGG